MVCAVLAGIGAALFLTLGPTVTVNGATRSCPGVIVASETHEGLPHSGACDRARTRWTWVAVGLGLVCLVAGTGATFYRREDPTPAVPRLLFRPRTRSSSAAHGRSEGPQVSDNRHVWAEVRGEALGQTGGHG